MRYVVTGEWGKTRSFLSGFSQQNRFLGILNKAGELGVEALRRATPKDSGITAASWSYEVKIENGIGTISWNNDSLSKGYNVAVLLQYGHATGTGGYVQSQDYINPAMAPVFTYLANEVWKEVTK